MLSVVYEPQSTPTIMALSRHTWSPDFLPLLVRHTCNSHPDSVRNLHITEASFRRLLKTNLFSWYWHIEWALKLMEAL